MMEDHAQQPQESPSDLQQYAGGGERVASSFTPGQKASTMSKVLVILFTSLLVIGGMYVASPDSASDLLVNTRVGFDQEVNRNLLLGYMTPFLAPGVTRPTLKAAEETRFAEATPVVGVSVGKVHRAYPTLVMQGFRPDGIYGGIVNDTLDGVLITVTHDTDAKLVRVFTPTEKVEGKVSRLRLAGMADGGALMLTFNDKDYYRQDARSVPSLKEYLFKEVTWGEWKAGHPDTDVYVGTFRTPDLQMEVSLAFMTPKERTVAEKVIAKRNRDAKILSPNRKKRRSPKASAAADSSATGATDKKSSGQKQDPDSGSAAKPDSGGGAGKSATRAIE